MPVNVTGSRRRGQVYPGPGLATRSRAASPLKLNQADELSPRPTQPFSLRCSSKWPGWGESGTEGIAFCLLSLWTNTIRKYYWSFSLWYHGRFYRRTIGVFSGFGLSSVARTYRNSRTAPCAKAKPSAPVHRKKARNR